jgi:hypothetical protein
LLDTISCDNMGRKINHNSTVCKKKSTWKYIHVTCNVFRSAFNVSHPGKRKKRGKETFFVHVDLEVINLFLISNLEVINLKQ